MASYYPHQILAGQIRILWIHMNSPLIQWEFQDPCLWRYVSIICLAIFCGDITTKWYPHKIIKMVGTSNHRFLKWPSGWWFETLFIPYVGNVIIPTDEVISFRGISQPPSSCINHYTWYDVISHYECHYECYIIPLSMPYPIINAISIPLSMPYHNISYQPLMSVEPSRDAKIRCFCWTAESSCACCGNAGRFGGVKMRRSVLNPKDHPVN